MLDSVDIKILKLLEENARMNASVIGEKISMSVSAVIERIRKLENSGIIKKYTVLVDYKKIDMDVSAYISICMEDPKHMNAFIKAIQNIPEILECHYIAGDYDFLLKVLTKSTGTLAELLNKIKSLPGASLTRTLVVLETHKDGRIVLDEGGIK